MTVVSFRTDPEVDEALKTLGDEYGSRTDTLKEAVLQLAHNKRKREMRKRSLELLNDPVDRAESKAILAEMEQLSEG